MMSTKPKPVEIPRSRLRDRMKDVLLSPTASIKLPRFLSNEPQSPARYEWGAISAGYSSSRDLKTSPGKKEQWYFPPDVVSPSSQQPKMQRKHRASKSRDGGPVTPSQRTPRTLSQQNTQNTYFSENFNGTPRVSSSPERYFPLIPQQSPELGEQTSFKPLRIHDLRNEKKILYADVEIRSGLLYDLIQTLPSVWLTTPQIKESFIPLLRSDCATTQVRAPTPNELRLIEGFLTHLPDVHIVPSKRFNRISDTWAS